MYRANDRTMEEEEEKSGGSSAWPDLVPAILSAIASRLSRRDQGAMRLSCSTWSRAVAGGLQELTVVLHYSYRLPFKSIKMKMNEIKPESIADLLCV